MESSRVAFCLSQAPTGLVAGPRHVLKAVVAASKEQEQRSLAGLLMAERKPENQKRSTSAATNLHRGAQGGGEGGAERPDIASPAKRNPED